MLIECPQCNAQYNLPALEQTNTAKRMKCAKCTYIFTPNIVTPAKNSSDGDDKMDAENDVMMQSGLDDDLLWEEAMNEPVAFDVAFDDTSADIKNNPSVTETHLDGRPNEPAHLDASHISSSNNDGGANHKLALIRLASTIFLVNALNRTTPIIRRLLALSRKRKATLAGGVLAPMAIIGVLFTAQQSVVRQFPELASLYELAGIEVNLRGLDIVDAYAAERVDNGVNVLVVNGTVRNLTDRDKALPPLQLVFQARKRTIYSWQHEWESASIIANGSKPFQVLLASPPDVADELQLRFFR